MLEEETCKALVIYESRGTGCKSQMQIEGDGNLVQSEGRTDTSFGVEWKDGTTLLAGTSDTLEEYGPGPGSVELPCQCSSPTQSFIRLTGVIKQDCQLCLCPDSMTVSWSCTLVLEEKFVLVCLPSFLVDVSERVMYCFPLPHTFIVLVDESAQTDLESCSPAVRHVASFVSNLITFYQ